MFLSKLGYSESVQRLFEKMTFFLVDPLVLGFAGLCQLLSLLDMPGALSVLHPSIGEFLEHCQLRRDPRYKATWDTSYANELG